MSAPTQRQRNLTTPFSRTKRRSPVPIAVVVLGTVGLVGIAGLLYFVSLQNAGKSQTVLSHPKIRSAQMMKTNPSNDPVVPDKEQVDETSFDEQETDAIGGTAILTLEIGTVQIELRPDLSPESAKYIHELANSETCERCVFYRAEKPGILQGIMKNPDMKTEMAKGICPPEFQNVQQPECPPHNPNCACHGPTMTRGMVGWAGGGTGPDFFIDLYKQPAEFWGQQHTVFGQITDTASLELLDNVFTLPVTKKGGMTFLDEKLHFTIKVDK